MDTMGKSGLGATICATFWTKQRNAELNTVELTYLQVIEKTVIEE